MSAYAKQTIDLSQRQLALSFWLPGVFVEPEQSGLGSFRVISPHVTTELLKSV